MGRAVARATRARDDVAIPGEEQTDFHWRDAPRRVSALAIIALRTPVELAGLGLTLERHARHARHARRALARSASGTALAALDRTLGSTVAGEAVDRVVASEVAEHAVSATLEGPLVEIVARDLVRLAAMVISLPFLIGYLRSS